jgi:hypothetical protein
VLDKVEFLQIQLSRVLGPSLHRVCRQITTFHSARNAPVCGNVIAQLHNLDPIFFLHTFQMLCGINAQIADPGWQTECVRAFSQKCRLEEGVEEGDPIARPIQGALLSTVAGSINAYSQFTIIISLNSLPLTMYL